MVESGLESQMTCEVKSANVVFNGEEGSHLVPPAKNIYEWAKLVFCM